MTRMLCRYILLFAFLLLGGCSLFQSEETVSASDIDNESISDSEISGLDGELEEGSDLEDEMKAENDELGEAEVDEVSFDDSEDSADFADEEFDENFSEEDFDAEFADAELDDDSEVAQMNTSDEDDLSGFSFAEDFSESDEQAIDQSLVSDELAQEEVGFDNFGADAQPVIDEPSPEQAVVDVPIEDSAPIESSSVADGTQVTNLEYKAFENGGTVVIETSSPVPFQKTWDSSTNQVIVKLDNVGLPERFKRPYITKDFKQDIATINAYADDSGGARFVIQMKRPIDPVVQQEGSSLLVMTSVSTAQMASGQAPSPSMGMDSASMEVVEVDNSVAITNPVVDQELAQATPKATTKVAVGTSSAFNEAGEAEGVTLNPLSYSGKKISLQFIDTDVRDIIEVIAQKTGLNLITDKDVDGTTSVRLRNVPWDQALLVILRSQGLGYVKQGSVLRIARQRTLSDEAAAVSKQIESEKRAKQIAGGLKVKYIPVSYAKVEDLSKKLKEFSSKEGRVSFDTRTSSLVITDYGEYVERMIELVKALDLPPLQVEIESKLVEAREDFIREAGINWTQTGTPKSFGGDKTATISSRLNNNLGSTGLTMDLDVGVFDIFGNLTASLNLFENQNKLKILSEPKIRTLNKVKGEIEQITQVPIRQIIVNGNVTTETFLFQDLSLLLGVTPQVTFKGDVILEVELKREFAGQAAGDGQRELNRRKAKTTVMVGNGKTAVIGGIYQIDDTELENGVPLLKDIPLLGNLFRFERTEKIKNELLLFLKPKILRQELSSNLSKASLAPTDTYDPFEELSVDEGSTETATNTLTEEPSATEEGEALEDELESDLEEEGFSL